LEVAIAGRRQGVNKKNLNNPSSRLCIAKCELFKEYKKLLSLQPQLKQKLFPDCQQFDELDYQHLKLKSKDYCEQWQAIKAQCYKVWTIKPEGLLNFKTKE
jgi:hypothetical protein